MKECSISLQIVPRVDRIEMIRAIDMVIDYIASTGVTYFVGPCETTMEGDFDCLIDILRECHKICIKNNFNELMSFVKIIYNPNNGVLSIDEKIKKFS